MASLDSKNNPPSAHIVNCWNSIGVWGRERPRCPVLQEVIHCRNCDKYIAAGQRALQRPVPDEYEQEWTHNLARKKDTDTGHHLTVIIFRVGDEWFSLPVNYLQQVETRRVIHSVPHRNSAIVKGVVNVAGEVKMCFSLGALLGVEQASTLDATQRTAVYEGLIVLKSGKRGYVFPVTEVLELARISLEEIKAVPSTVSAVAASYLLGLVKFRELHIGHLDADLVMAGFERNL
jgi:chemotaxis-related protein WspD